MRENSKNKGRVTSALMSMLAIVALVASSFVTGAQTASASTVGTPQQEQLKHANMIAEIFDEHNKHRRANGLAPVVFSPAISLRVTQPFTNVLANTDNGTIWHNTRADIGRGGSGWGENVAGGFPEESAPALVQRWMDSPGHRKNILTASHTTIAIGFAIGPKKGNWTFSTVNLYRKPLNPGTTYKTGAEWLASLKGTPTPPSGEKPTDPDFNVYLTPGTYDYNGRLWRTRCEPYSQTKRCRTELWGDKVTHVNGTYVHSEGWIFNNLTYAPSPRTLWKSNTLGGGGVVGSNKTWKAQDGRMWRTECDSANTGRGGCRSYIAGTVIEVKNGTYKAVNKEIFNNLVLFSP